MIFAIGFLSMVNLVLSLVTSNKPADENDLPSEDERVAASDAIPEARMLNLASTVLDALQTLEEKYYSS